MKDYLLHCMQNKGPPGHDMEVLNVAQKIEGRINWQHPKFYEDRSNSLQADKEDSYAIAM